MDDDPDRDNVDVLFVADAEVRANGGEVVYRGPLRADDQRWPAAAAARHRGLRIADLGDPNRAWVILVFPDGSVRLNPRVARGCWWRDQGG